MNTSIRKWDFGHLIHSRRWYFLICPKISILHLSPCTSLPAPQAECWGEFTHPLLKTLLLFQLLILFFNLLTCCQLLLDYIVFWVLGQLKRHLTTYRIVWKGIATFLQLIFIQTKKSRKILRLLLFLANYKVETA